MERTFRGGGRVWTNLNESHEKRRNGEKFSWYLKLLKIPRDDEILRDFSLINANAVHVSKCAPQIHNKLMFSTETMLNVMK